MRTSIIMAGWIFFACAAALGVTPSRAAQSVAVFPFELLDQSQDGELILKVRPEETKRLALLTQDLKDRLTAAKTFQIADISPLAAQIKSDSPLHKCDDCLAALAKKLAETSNVDLAMLGLVQKFSDTLLSVSIQIIDAKSGSVTKTYNAGIQGNTDEAWLRGVSYIVRNKILEGASQ